MDRSFHSGTLLIRLLSVCGQLSSIPGCCFRV